jgi:DNA-binding XRE family transcriptional regulator
MTLVDAPASSRFRLTHRPMNVQAIPNMKKGTRSLASFGQNVRNVRTASGLTQRRVATIAHLDPTYISGIERGVRNPTLRIISRLAKALEVPVEKLCAGVRD